MEPDKEAPPAGANGASEGEPDCVRLAHFTAESSRPAVTQPRVRRKAWGLAAVAIMQPQIGIASFTGQIPQLYSRKRQTDRVDVHRLSFTWRAAPNPLSARPFFSGSPLTTDADRSHCGGRSRQRIGAQAAVSAIARYGFSRCQWCWQCALVTSASRVLPLMRPRISTTVPAMLALNSWNDPSG